MYITSISSYKGGTGKTTTAVNLAYNLSALGHRVLIIDTDPQANATYMLSRVTENARTLTDLLAGCRIRSCIRRTRYDRLDIIKGSSRLEEADGEPLLLRRELRKLDGRYDYCIIDCHPSMQIPTIAAAAASDLLIVPFRPNGYGKTGLIILEDYVHQIRRELGGCLEFRVLITQYAGRRSQTRVLVQLTEDYGYPIFDTVIQAGEAVNTSIAARKPLALHRRGAKTTMDYQEFTKEFITCAHSEKGGAVNYG